MRKVMIALVLIMGLLGIGVDVEANTYGSCTSISSVPYTIRTGGNYCLTGNMTTSGSGIIIQADNVVIDFQGNTIFGSQAGNNTYVGIRVNNRSNVTIRNGEIVGFFYAILIEDHAYGQNEPFETGWHVVEDMEVSRSTFRGIVVQGVGNVVRGNNVSHIQGNTFYANSFAIGIEAMGQGFLIQDNFVYEVRGCCTGTNIGEGVGISVSSEGSGGTITDNLISNISIEETSGTDWAGLSNKTIGIWVGGDDGLIISGNEIQNYMTGIAFSSTVGDSLVINNLILGSYLALSLSPVQHTVVSNVCGQFCFEDYAP